MCLFSSTDVRIRGPANTWLWNNQDPALRFALTSTGWSCSIYARAWNRLELIGTNRYREELIEVGPCNADAIQFGLCMPFYGCLLASLQNAVRSYYGIDGDDCQDCCDGCCSPLDTLVRNEAEIILRQRTGRGPVIGLEKEYICYDPMAYPQTLEQPAVVVREESLPNKQNNVTVYETNAGPADAKVAVAAKSYCAHDRYQPARTARQALHTLEDDVAVAPVAKVVREHALHDDPESTVHIKYVPHDLGAVATRTVPLKN